MAMDWSDILTYLGGGAVLGSLSGSEEAGTTTSTQAPWGPQQDYLKDLFERAKTMSETPAISDDMASAYSGLKGAINTDLQDQAQTAISSTLGMDPTKYFGIGATNPYLGQTTAAATNDYMGMDNPYLTAAIDNASAAAKRNIMPAYNKTQRISGSFGNSGVDDYFGRAAGDQIGAIANNAYMGQFNQQQQLAQNMGQFNASLASQDLTRNSNLAQTGITNDLNQYNTGMATLNNAAFNAPQFSAAALNPYSTLYNAASTQNAAQWNPLQNYSALVRGTYGGTSTTPYFSNPIGGLLGGAAAGASIYNAVNR